MIPMKRGILLKNYGIDEGKCACGCGQSLQDDTVLALQAFISVLERVYGASVRHLITSGARCARHNAATPGASPDSQHVGGGAADGYFEYLHRAVWKRIEPSDVASLAVKSGLFGGVGYLRYAREGSHIVHLDTRPGPTKTW